MSKKSHNKAGGFMDFIREQGVVGLAVGLVLGAAVKDVVNSLVSDFVNPVLGLFLGGAGNLESYTLVVSNVTFYWGHFLSVLLDFVVIAAVIYFVVKGLNLENLDKKDK